MNYCDINPIKTQYYCVQFSRENFSGLVFVSIINIFWNPPLGFEHLMFEDALMDGS